MKKFIFILMIILISLIVLPASEKVTKDDPGIFNSSYSFKLTENLINSNLVSDYATQSSVSAANEAKFSAFCFRNRMLFLGLGIGLSAGAIAGLSIGIAGAAIWGYYYTNFINIHSSNTLEPSLANNYYYAGTALLGIGWTLFVLCLIPAAGSWVCYAFSFRNKKASLNLEVYPNELTLAIKF